jgi:Uma2 family endonuclease
MASWVPGLQEPAQRRGRQARVIRPEPGRHGVPPRQGARRRHAAAGRAHPRLTSSPPRTRARSRAPEVIAIALCLDMSSAARTSPAATIAELMALAEDRRFHEVIAGELVQKATPSGEHGGAQAALTGSLFGPFNRRSGGRYPGGWWFETEVELELEPHEIYRPDVIGWRRERVPERPGGTPVRIMPDWICEVLSPSNARDDQVTKFDTYRRCKIFHYWIVDPLLETLRVHRWTQDGYLVVLNAQRGQRVRAEPFDAIELPVGVLFGDDPDEP